VTIERVTPVAGAAPKLAQAFRIRPLGTSSIPRVEQTNTLITDPKRSAPSWFGSILEAKLPAPPVCGFLSPRQP
jgi:hypothetical protein